jgi:lysophospholipid acyltransferase (LPLAT)-like uncharacterized protein
VNERRLRWTIRVGIVLVRLLGWTWRIRVRHAAPVDALRARRAPFVYAIWHGQLLPLIWAHRDLGVVALISEHRDGEIIARIVERLGYRTIRGSLSRGAARALVAITSELERGNCIAVTPDGPRGPAREFAPGALIAAHRAGVPIVPVAMHASRAWRLRSWDGFTIPKPFARVVVAYGEPTMVDAESSRAAAERGPAFQALVNEACARAEA